MKKLIWSRLKNFKCPKCNQDLISAQSGERGVGCEYEECNFYISQPVFDRVVENLYQTEKGYVPKFGDDMENFELLQNMDRESLPATTNE